MKRTLVSSLRAHAASFVAVAAFGSGFNKDRLRGRRTRFTDAERALLARKAKAVGRKALLELDTIVAPDTLLRWHRRLVAQKWNFAERRGVGRPGIMRHISQLIVRMAQENPSWGYTRLQGALANLTRKVGCVIAEGTSAERFRSSSKTCG